MAKLGDREESDDGEVHEMLEDLFASVVTATDSTDTNRLLHLAFRLLPSKNVRGKTQRKKKHLGTFESIFLFSALSGVLQSHSRTN